MSNTTDIDHAARIRRGKKGWTYAKFLLGNERTSMAGIIDAAKDGPRTSTRRCCIPSCSYEGSRRTLAICSIPQMNLQARFSAMSQSSAHIRVCPTCVGANFRPDVIDVYGELVNKNPAAFDKFACEAQLRFENVSSIRTERCRGSFERKVASLAWTI